MTEADSLDINFKSTLPPRKRAKTKEEKEQRRVERILRNRRAAHASREKKRRHVEFLESYVMKLESNLDRLQKNFDTVSSKVDSTALKGLRLSKLDDLSSLKEQIHLNLGLVSLEPETRRRRTMTDDSPERESSVEKESSAESALATGDESGCEVQVKVEYDDTEDFSLSNTNSNDNVYFNYLSPISINSPVNSPIDLTLKKSDEEVTPLSLGGEESVREDEGLGQNSAAPAIPKDSTAQLNGTFSEDMFDSVLKTDPYDVLFSDLSQGDFESKMLSDYTLNEMSGVNDIGEFLSI